MDSNACQKRSVAAVKPRHGLTFVELIVVLLILVGLGSIVIPRIVTDLDDSFETTTRASLVVVRDATTQYWSDCKYLIAQAEVADPDFGVRIDDLIVNPFGEAGEFDPATGLGWRGPYLAATSAVTINDPDDPWGDLPDQFRSDSNFNDYFRVDTATAAQVSAPLDTWGTPIIIQDVTAFNATGANPSVSGQARTLRIVSAGGGTAGLRNSIERKNSIRVDHSPTAEAVDDDGTDDYSLTLVVR